MKETNDYGMYSGGYIFDQMDRDALMYIKHEAGLSDDDVIVTMAVDGLRFKRQLCDKYNITIRCFDFHKIELFSVLYTCKAEVLNNKGETVAEAQFTFTKATNHCETKEEKMVKETSETIKQWHEETFPDATLDGQLEKLQEEIKEYMNAKTDEEKLFELADMAIVVMGIRRFDEEHAKELIFMVYESASEDGFDMTELWNTIQKKMEKNRNRVWNKTGNGTYHHKNGAED